MSISVGIIIFFLSLIALVAEFIIYMMLGIGVALSGVSDIGSLAWFFVGLMVLTGTIGVLSPISAIIQQTSKKERIGNKILLIGVLVIMFGYVLLTTLGGKQPQETETLPAMSRISQEEAEVKTEQQKQEEIKAILLKKGFINEDWRKEIYSDYITFEVEFTNTTNKDIRGFKGVFTFYDIFGDKIQDVIIAYDEGIKAGETKIWKGMLEYNPFIDSHVKLKNTDLKDLQHEWKTEQIIYVE